MWVRQELYFIQVLSIGIQKVRVVSLYPMSSSVLSYRIHTTQPLLLTVITQKYQTNQTDLTAFFGALMLSGGELNSTQICTKYKRDPIGMSL